MKIFRRFKKKKIKETPPKIITEEERIYFEFIKKAETVELDGRYEDAVSIRKEIISKYPDDTRSLYDLAENLKVLGRYKEAIYREYKLFQEITDANSSVIARLQDNVVFDTIEHRTLTDDDKKAGVQKDMVVRLGSKKKQKDITKPMRVIEVFHKGSSSRATKSRVSSQKTSRTTKSDYTFRLTTDRMDLSAEIIALIFRYRWQIELFFRWFKCILSPISYSNIINLG